MVKNILNTIAYQKYATQCLYNALLELEKAAFVGERGKKEFFSMLAMKCMRDILGARDRLENLLEGGALQDSLATMADAESAMARNILEATAQLETLCVNQMAEVKKRESACIPPGKFSLCPASATPQ